MIEKALGDDQSRRGTVEMPIGVARFRIGNRTSFQRRFLNRGLLKATRNLAQHGRTVVRNEDRPSSPAIPAYVLFHMPHL
jgi:hypothetical protein